MMPRSLGVLLLAVLGLSLPKDVYSQKFFGSGEGTAAHAPSMTPPDPSMTQFPTSSEFAGLETTAAPVETLGSTGEAVAGTANQLGALSGATTSAAPVEGGMSGAMNATVTTGGLAASESPTTTMTGAGGSTGATTTTMAPYTPVGGAATTAPVGGGVAGASANSGAGAGVNASTTTFVPGTAVPGTAAPATVVPQSGELAPTSAAGGQPSEAAGHTGEGSPTRDGPTFEGGPTGFGGAPTDDAPTDDQGPTGGEFGWDMSGQKSKAPVPYVPPKDEDDPFAGKQDESEWQGGGGGGGGTWPRESPQQMMHDRNVIIAVSSVFGVAFLLIIITAQQTIENPDGCCASLCRCWVAVFCVFFKILCWPCRLCCGNKDRRTHDLMMGDSNSYTHDLELT